MKVVLQNGCHVMMEIAKRLHQPGDSRISRGMFKFGTRYHRIVGNIRHTSRARLPAYVAEVRLIALQHIADHQRTGINKRITRNTLLHFQLH